MNATSATNSDYPTRDLRGTSGLATGQQRTSASAVSWGAIVAGAAGAAALSLSLLTLGVGLGMATMSPWSPAEIGAAEVGASSIVWLALTSILASAFGGYLAGRLRTRWADAQSDEVYFRDTAHGFLTWALATLLTATLLASVVSSIVGSGVQAGASVVGATTSLAATTAATAASDADESSMDYFVDLMFRADRNSTSDAGSYGASAERSSAADALEVRRIFTHMLGSETLPPEDARHLAQLVARRTGLGPAEAEARVNATYARAQTTMREVEQRAMQAAETARKATAYGSLWLFIAMLAGAFVASLAATFGGRQRDL